MMNLTLKISPKENINMSQLLIQMCSLKCRITVDLEENNISIIEMQNSEIETVIDSIAENFDISGIDIVPVCKNTDTDKQDIVETVSTEQDNSNVKEGVTGEILEKKDDESVTTEQKMDSEKMSAEISEEASSKMSEKAVNESDIEVPKILFHNPEVEEQANKLMNMIARIVEKYDVPAFEICKFLKSTGFEIAMKYNPKETVEISVGDIVICNYGTHIEGEISGGYVHAIVCDIDEDNMFYAVPITKQTLEEDVLRYLPVKANEDICYFDSRYTGGTALLRKAKYMHIQRVQSVVGTAHMSLMNKLWNILPQSFSFSKTELPVETNEIFVENSAHEKEFVAKEKDAEISHKDNNQSVEKFVESIVKNALEKLDETKPIREQVETFLDEINFSEKSNFIIESFVVACEMKKITYENITAELHKKDYPYVNVKQVMRACFKKWLENYPGAQEKYPVISFIILLKVFAKKMKKSIS